MTRDSQKTEGGSRRPVMSSNPLISLYRICIFYFAALFVCTTLIATPSLSFAAEADRKTSRLVALPAGNNTETEDFTSDPAGEAGFSISVDGQTIAGDLLTSSITAKADVERQADIDLEAIDVQIKYDGLDVQPILNVSTVDARSAYRIGTPIEFLATSNYPAWINRSEILVYSSGKSDRSRTPIATIPVDANGNALWDMPAGGDDGEYEYVLRVYDDRNRFDETLPLPLTRTNSDFEKHATTSDEEPVSAGNGEDRTATRNIPVYGGAVTVFGKDVPQGYSVSALDETIPVDRDSSFVVQRILPPGDHNVAVSVQGNDDAGVNVNRSINIPTNDLFYVGLIDFTLGKRFGSDYVVAAAPDEYDSVYTRGRLAFYLKGKVKGRYLITAAADTGEEEIETLFSGLDSKNPRELLRRIDPDKYYPVYGDDSTSKEDAPTSGKFYVKVERNDSHVMWGNFKSSIKGDRYLRSERTLYGAQARYRSEDTTSFGERKTEVELYAAQPGTLPQRDVLRGTGGSAYFLKRQDISIGSETISVQLRDPVTGNVVETITLDYGDDYTIDYIQGVIILSRPISSTAAGAGVVRDTALGDYDLNLVAQYEYTPTIGDVDGYSYGGRAQSWIDDRVRLGFTGMVEETGNGANNADQEMLGVDLKIRHSETTYLSAEYAQTKGPGFSTSTSTDGGLTIIDETPAGLANRIASAWRIRGQLDLADISQDRIAGRIGAYYEEKEAGFETLDHNIDVDQRLWGAFAHFDLSDKLSIGLTYEDFSDDDDKKRRQATIDASYQLDEYWKITLGAKYSDLSNPAGDPEDNGERTDVAVQVAYSPNEDYEFYAFAQATAQTSGARGRNDRLGVGAKVRLSEKVAIEGEISEGSTGLDAQAGVTYSPTVDEQYYIAYRLESERSKDDVSLDGDDLGRIVLGAKRRYDDLWSAYSENNYDMFGTRRELTSTYGVTYTPDSIWTVNGGFEFGRIEDPNASDFDRKAISVGVSYKDEDRFTAKLRGEVRIDESDDDTRDVRSFLFTGGIGYKVDENWRFIGKLDGLISQSDQGDFLDGDYVEASLGFAYRPTDNDRLNALFKYTYLYDLPGVDQVTSNGSTFGPRQNSHVLSADANYRLNNNFSIGGKYGFRIGQVETFRGSGVYADSSAHLGIIRADVHIVHNWDLMVEGRVLWSPSADTTDLGAVIAGYRHFGKNVKAGIGYNFGRFSDDLTDLTFDDQGVFLNVIGKF